MVAALSIGVCAGTAWTSSVAGFGQGTSSLRRVVSLWLSAELSDPLPVETADGPTGLRLRADKASDVQTGTLAQMTRFLIRMAVKTYVPSDLSGLQRESWRTRTKRSCHDSWKKLMIKVRSL